MDEIIGYVNITVTLLGILISVLLLIVGMQFRAHRGQMSYFLYSVCVTVVGLGLQVADQYYIGTSYNLYFLSSRAMYSLVAPFFTLYFMETGRDEGEVWNRKFWTSIQFLTAVLVSAFAILGQFNFLVQMTTLFQFIVVLFMMLFSQKGIRACIGFIIGILFPITSTLVGIVDPRLDLLGISQVMLLLSVFSLYQLDTEREVLQSRTELSEKKVALLMEQIHPHFIYNSLQQIAILSEEDAKAVKPAIQNFSGYLRRKFQALTGESMIPFEDELEHVDMYIDLAKILPSRRFEVEKDLTATDFMIPPLTLQPLVENAIQYGVGMSEEGEKIRITSVREKGYIVITVQDNGHGKRTELQTQKRYKSVGTENVRTRLSLLCNGELSIDKTEYGTTATIRIPESERIVQKK